MGILAQAALNAALKFPMRPDRVPTKAVMWASVTALRERLRARWQEPWGQGLAASLALLLLLAFVYVSGATAPMRVQALGPTTRAPSADVTLSVEVRRNGQGVANAAVRVLLTTPEERQAEWGSGTTDDKGLAFFDGLSPGRGWLIVEAEGASRKARPLLLFGQHRFVVDLGGAHALGVEVVDDLGKPLQGATVLVRDSGVLPFGGLTDAQGKHAFAKLASSPWTVEVFARGYESQRRDQVTSDQRFVLRKLGSLLVQVIDTDGSPAPEAQVLVVGSTLWPARRALTDAEGKVTLAGLPPGVYNLKAQLGAKASPELAGISLERAEHRRVELRLRGGQTLLVKVVDASPGYDEPLEGAQVVLAEYGISSFPISATTGKDGIAFLAPVPIAGSFVSVTHEGFVPRSAVPVLNPGSEPLRIALLRGATLRGTVTDPDGRPIDGARVEVLGTDTDGLPIDASPLLSAYRDNHFRSSLEPLALVAGGELGVTVGPVPFVSEALSGQAWTEMPVNYEPWLTDFAGDFEAFPVPPGRVRALVSHPSYVEGMSPEVALAPGGEAKVRVVLSPGGQLEGRVVDDGGRPVPLARISVSAVRGSFERSVYAMDDGTFAFSAVPTEVIVQLARPDDPTRYLTREQVRVPVGATKEIELVLPEPREPIVVEVVDTDERAIELAQVQFTSVDAEVPLRASRFSDSEGRVSLEDASGLALRVVVSAPSYLSFSKQYKSAPAALRITLERGVKVTGRITGVRGRRDVASARINLEGASYRESAYSDGNGNYEFDNVPVGTARLTVTHPEFATAHREVEIKRTLREDRAHELPDVDLAEGASISGKVVDTSGNPVRGARVGLGFAPAVVVKGILPEGFVLCDGEGRFSLALVEPGAHTVSAYADGVGRGSVDVDVEEARNLDDIEIMLDEPVDDEGVDPRSGGVAVTLGERDTDDGTRVVIVNVVAGSEAERAGLLAGDVIVGVDGKKAKDMRTVRQSLNGRVSSDVVVTVERDGSRSSFRVRREPVGG